MPEKQQLKNILVYCGASTGSKPVYKETAKAFGYLLAEKNIGLVYGGGSIGLMGIIADAVLEKGGHVTGVIPHFLNTAEVGHNGVSELILVENMHERKALMLKRCDAVVALPGGFGTLDELFEALTWSQLELHRKPIGLLNVEGYYDQLLALSVSMQTEGFLQPATRNLLLHDTDMRTLLQQLENNLPPAGTADHLEIS
jgi:uncharacterized protein (TIGR00730 family)